MGMIPFWELFLDQAIFPHSYITEYSCFFKASTLLKNQSVMYEREFLKPESMYAIMTWGFPIRYFFQYCSERFQIYVNLLFFFESL